MFIIKSMLYRLMQMIVVLFVISTLTFILMKLSPGNPVDKILHLDVAASVDGTNKCSQR